MTTPIKIKRSGTASSTPSSLDHGELAINYADDTLFWKDSSNVIQSFVFQAYASATHKSTHATGGSDALTPADIGAAPAASPAITGNATFEASSGVPLTVTNTGSDNSFVVNDAAGDTTPFLIDASGNVGILRSTPTVPLTFSNAVAAPATPSKEEQTNKIRLYDDGTYQFGFGISTGSINIAANGGTLATMRFWTDSVERMRITAAGLVGIGRTVPASALDVNGVITVAATSGSAGSYLPSLTFSGDANTGFGQVSGQSDTASIFTAGHERVRVDASGRVGINISNPSNRLSVVGQFSAGSVERIANNSGAGGFYDRLEIGGGTQATRSYGSLWVYNSSNSQTHQFHSYPGTDNYINNGGKLGIGTSSPSAALDINSDTIRLRTAKTPASASDTGNAGDICWDASYLYICTATNTWRRIAHSTW